MEAIAIYHIVYHCAFFKCVCFRVGAHVWVDCCFGDFSQLQWSHHDPSVSWEFLEDPISQGSSVIITRRFASLQVAGVDFTSSVETKMVRSLLLGCSHLLNHGRNGGCGEDFAFGKPMS